MSTRGTVPGQGRLHMSYTQHILYTEAGATEHAAIKPASAVYTVPLPDTLRTHHHSYFRVIVVFASPCRPFMQY